VTLEVGLVHLGNHQRHEGVHAERARVVDDHRAGLDRRGGELQRPRGAGREEHVLWPRRDDQRELQRALAGFLHGEAAPAADEDSPLTSRETEVLRLVATGMSNREIATTLVLSDHTVHRHVANILRKLSQPSRAAAATQAARAGMI